MKLPTERISTVLNTFSLAGLSLLWGHMLGLINLWFMPLTVLCLIIGYGSEINAKNAKL